MDLVLARQRLRRFVDTSKKVRLTRPFARQRLHNGVIMGVGRDLVAIRQFHDFQPEGYAVLRIRDITGIRSGRFERKWEQMLAAEGLLEHDALQSDMPLDSIALLLKALQQDGRNIIVECETLDKSLDDYYIGKVLGVTDTLLYFANFDAMGRWDKHPDTISLSEITNVQIDTPYSNTFSKYLTGSCPQLSKTQRKQFVRQQ